MSVIRKHWNFCWGYAWGYCEVNYKFYWTHRFSFIQMYFYLFAKLNNKNMFCPTQIHIINNFPDYCIGLSLVLALAFLFPLMSLSMYNSSLPGLRPVAFWTSFSLKFPSISLMMWRVTLTPKITKKFFRFFSQKRCVLHPFIRLKV